MSSYRCPVTTCCVAKKGEFITALPVEQKALAACSYLHLRISSLPHLLPPCRPPISTRLRSCQIGQRNHRSRQKTRQSIAGFVMHMRAHLHLATWDWNQESACIMPLDSAVRRCNRRPIEVCCAANLAQDECPHRGCASFVMAEEEVRWDC